MTKWNVDLDRNEAYMLKCMNKECPTGAIVDDQIECPDCGKNEVHVSRHTHDPEEFGTVEVREMMRVDLKTIREQFGLERSPHHRDSVLFVEDSKQRVGPNGIPSVMPHMVLRKEFAAGLQRIRVTVEAIRKEE